MPNPLGFLGHIYSELLEIKNPECEAAAEVIRIAELDYHAAPEDDYGRQLDDLAMAACIGRRLMQKNGRHGYDA